MDVNNSLAHTTWNCKYHIVFAPKYRRRVFFGEKRKEIGAILRQLCEWKNVRIIEAEVCPDHIHMLVAIPPKMSVSGFMGYLKGKSSVLIYQRFANLQYKYRHREFWCAGYYVDTVGKNTKKIQTPNLLLTTRSFNVIGKISNFNNWKISLVGNGVDEISFDVHKFVNGKICPIWDDLVDLKIVQVMGFGNFEISVDYTDNTETVKSVHGKSLEVELSQIPLNDFHVNDDDAKSMKQTEYNAVDFDENGNFISTTFYNPKDENHSLLHRVLKV